MLIYPFGQIGSCGQNGWTESDGCPDEFWKDSRSTSVSIFKALDIHSSLSMAGVSQPGVVGDLLGGVWIGESSFRLSNPKGRNFVSFIETAWQQGVQRKRLKGFGTSTSTLESKVMWVKVREATIQLQKNQLWSFPSKNEDC